MSAFMCSDHHLSVLAHYAVRHRCLPSHVPAVSTAQDVLEILHTANEASLRGRYPHLPHEEVTPELCVKAFTERYTPVAMIKACHCYAYQCCEVRSWFDSTAKQITDLIKEHAIQRLPGYEQAPWCLEVAS